MSDVAKQLRRTLLLLAGVAAYAVVLACNQTTIQTPLRVLDGPSDVALGCTVFHPGPDGGAQDYYEALPTVACRPENVPQNTLGPDGGAQYAPGLRGLVVNSVRGELAEVDIPNATIIDLNRAVPGYGFLPVGRQPEHIRTSDDGCIAVTANVASCDLAIVDLPTLYNAPFATERPGNGHYADNVVRRLKLTLNGVPLAVRPTWIELAPESTPGQTGLAGGAPGQCSGGSYKAWVALQSCGLIAEVDLDKADPNAPPDTRPVTRAIQVTPSGAQVVTDLSKLAACPAECAAADGGVFTPLPADAGSPPVVDGGIPPRLPSTQALPGTFAIDREGGTGRLVIGDAAGETVSIVPIDVTTGELGVPRAVRLEAGATGVSVVRVSPRSQAGKFLYAVARDGTVRVVDLDREVECETHPDPRALGPLPSTDVDPTLADPTGQARRLGCFPLGDPATPRREASAVSPGITLPSGALPRDVAFVHLDLPPPAASNQAPLAAAPGVVVGDFAWIISSDGRGTVVNIFDACPAPNLPDNQAPTGAAPIYYPECSLDPAHFKRSRDNVAQGNPGHPQPLALDRVSHRLRSGNDRFFLPTNPQDTAGAPRLQDETNPFTLTINGAPATAPTPTAPPSDAGVSDGGIADAGVTDAGVADLGGDAGDGGPVAVTLPSLVPITLPPELCLSGNLCDRYISFPDPDLVHNESWSLSWEGTLPNTARSQGRPRWDEGRFIDTGASFCSRGVQRGDKLILTGCGSDGDCGFSQRCFHDPGAPLSVTNGLCLAAGTSQNDAISRCGPLLRAERSYRIVSAKQGYDRGGSDGVTDELTLGEIYQPEHPVETKACPLDSDCNGFQVSYTDASGAVHQLSTACLGDSDGVRRCLVPCALGASAGAAQCAPTFQCAVSTAGDARCMKAPLGPNFFNQTCLSELQPYEIHAGNAFVVFGTTTGFLSSLLPDPTSRECVAPPMSSEYTRLRQSRIPIDPPPCPPGGPTTDILTPEFAPTNVCSFSNPNNPSATPGIHFENPIFTIGLAVPAVPPDALSLLFFVVGGGHPLALALGVDIQAQQPRVALTAPDGQTVFIVDEGKQTTATGLRGQLLRLSSLNQAVDKFFVIR